VTGERGIGKTTVKNEIIAYFQRNSNRFAWSEIECLDMNSMTMSTILNGLIVDLSSETMKQSIENRKRQVRRIIGELAQRKRVVLVIDEAQKLSMNTMESLKLITEMKWGVRTKLITVILFGQPELTCKLSRDEGLLLRVTQYRMKGYDQDEVIQYMDLRCRCAGGVMKDIFTEDVIRYIAENQYSPLHINHTCSCAMRAARRTGEKLITLRMIWETDGIRTPRQILRDNNLSVKQFASFVHIDNKLAGKMLDGNMDETTGEQRDRFAQGLTNLVRGNGDGIEYSRKKLAG